MVRSLRFKLSGDVSMSLPAKFHIKIASDVLLGSSVISCPKYETHMLGQLFYSVHVRGTGTAFYGAEANSISKS